jgi:hypothetical protein
MTHWLRVVGKFLILSLLLTFSTRAQSYQTATVVQLLFIQSADKQHSEWRYLIRIDKKTVYEITRHKGGKMEMQNKAAVQYRLEDHHMYILGSDKKETRFDIVDENSTHFTGNPAYQANLGTYFVFG